MNEREIAEILEMLASADPAERANMAWVLAQSPVADARVARALEERLEDRALCVLSIPYELGEVRWAMAHALAATRRALGSDERVGLEAVLAPISLDELLDLSDRSGIPRPAADGLAGAIERLEKLRELGRAPVRDLVLG